MEDNNSNGCVSIKAYLCSEKMTVSLLAEEPQKYFLSFKSGFCWSVCNFAVGYTVKFYSFKVL